MFRFPLLKFACGSTGGIGNQVWDPLFFRWKGVMEASEGYSLVPFKARLKSVLLLREILTGGLKFSFLQPLHSCALWLPLPVTL